MFGKNPVRPIEVERDGSTLAVQEVFYTIQGEGPFSGMPCVFIRLAGCNLRCHWCDTEFETGITNMLSIEMLAGMVDELFRQKSTHRKDRLVVLTGGEPLRQNVVPLLHKLLDKDGPTHHVQIETAGTVWPRGLGAFVDILASDPDVTLVCSPKTPKVHPMVQRACRHWKYVVAAGKTNIHGLPCENTQDKDGAPRDLFRDVPEGSTVWISPRDDHDGAKNEQNLGTAVQVCLDHGYRLSLQVHKLVGLP